jgi:hypothetical protein
MALSQKVTDSLVEAQGSLHTALHFASRSEKPAVVKQISDILVAIESVSKYEKMADSMEEMLRKAGFKGDFF